MNSKHEINYDYLRAVKILEKIKSPFDLIKFWSVSGPCIEKHPYIEKISKKNDS